MERTDSVPRSGRRDERGAALVEFALVAILLMTLLLGIVIFGVLLSKRQVLTQAAAEGARSAVPVGYTAAAPDNAFSAAWTTTNQSLEGVGGGRRCPSGTTTTNVLEVGALATDGVRCRFTVFDCADTVLQLQTAADTSDCIEVEVELDINASPALVPGSSLIGAFLPDTMTGTSVVGLSGLDAT